MTVDSQGCCWICNLLLQVIGFVALTCVTSVAASVLILSRFSLQGLYKDITGTKTEPQKDSITKQSWKVDSKFLTFPHLQSELAAL